MSRRVLGVVLVGVAACSSPDSLPSVSMDTTFSRTPRSEPWPLEGGTLTVSNDGRWAMASQPDRGTVAIADLWSQQIVGELPFGVNDRPGRIAEDSNDTFWVLLPGAGAVATFTAESKAAQVLKDVCSSPSGIAFDDASNETWVVCRTGLLVQVDATHVIAKYDVSTDLRDIVIWQHRLFVSRFKSAQMIEVSKAGKVLQTVVPSSASSVDGRTFEPTVAWKMVWTPMGPLMIHQESQMTAISTIPSLALDPSDPMDPTVQTSDSYLGAGSATDESLCQRPVVTTMVSQLGASAAPLPPRFTGAAVGVDLAFNQTNNAIAIASAGTSSVLTATATGSAVDVCDPAFTSAAVNGQPVAVAFTPGGLLVVQTRNPPTLSVMDSGQTMRLPPEGASPGFDLFHTQAAPQGIACASCHPAGLEDGHTWQFVPQGARRTQSLGGGVSNSAPYHWDGEFADIPSLLTEVMVHRMGGAPVAPFVEQNLVSWLDSVPSPAGRRPSDDPQAMRGAALFVSSGCESCHTEPRPTQSFDVGTGRVLHQSFQVPNLRGVSARLPVMHDGCAQTLAQRFDPSCGGTAPGPTANLTPVETDDLIAYLESL